jgi:hypothetical protein
MGHGLICTGDDRTCNGNLEEANVEITEEQHPVVGIIDVTSKEEQYWCSEMQCYIIENEKG